MPFGVGVDANGFIDDEENDDDDDRAEDISAERFASDAAGGASLSRRERPHLAVDTNGIVRAITNGATPVWPCSEPNVCPDDYCFTSLELVGARD